MVIPSSVVEISDSAFEECKSLKEVVFGAGSALKKICSWAFWKCTSLRNIQFPDSLETIGKYCFCESGLEEVVLPASVKNIEPRAF